MNFMQRLGLAARLVARDSTLSLSSSAGWVSLTGGGAGGGSTKYASLWACQQAVLWSEAWGSGVSAIAEAVAMATPQLRVVGSKEIVTAANHPAAKLLAKPNSYENFAAFIERSVWYLYNTGEIRWNTAQTSMGGTPLQIINLRPERLGYIPDAEKRVAEWRYTGGDGKTHTIKPEDVFSLLFTHPADDVRGLSKARQVARSLETDEEISKWVAGFFRNSARAGSKVKFPGAAPNPEQVALLRSQMEDAHQGSANTGKPIILYDGADFEFLDGNGPKEVDFGETSKRLREKIHGMLRVPPIKVGIVENANRSNSDAQERSFQLDTINPLLKKLEGLLTQVVQRIDPRLEVAYPKAVLRDDDVQSQIAARFFTMGAITPNEVREDYLGKEALETPGMDDTYIPVSAVPTSEAEMAATQPAAAGNAPSGPIQSPQLDVQGKGGAAAGRVTFRPVR